MTCMTCMTCMCCVWNMPSWSKLQFWKTWITPALPYQTGRKKSLNDGPFWSPSIRVHQISYHECKSLRNTNTSRTLCVTWVLITKDSHDLFVIQGRNHIVPVHPTPAIAGTLSNSKRTHTGCVSSVSCRICPIHLEVGSLMLAGSKLLILAHLAFWCQIFLNMRFIKREVGTWPFQMVTHDMDINDIQPHKVQKTEQEHAGARDSKGLDKACHFCYLCCDWRTNVSITSSGLLVWQ